MYHIATTITDMLIKILKDEPLQERQRLVAPELVLRESTGPLL
ncbi:MAG: hypothetical protein H6649_05135 [Caldilineae bacterium]|nr:hypothetical protein [Caldilineae bacterium]